MLFALIPFFLPNKEYFGLVQQTKKQAMLDIFILNMVSDLLSLKLLELQFNLSSTNNSIRLNAEMLIINRKKILL